MSTSTKNADQIAAELRESATKRLDQATGMVLGANILMAEAQQEMTLADILEGANATV